MNPFANIEIGTQVIVTKRVLHNNSNVPIDEVGKLFTIREVQWDGRAHNRFVSSVIINGHGASYRAIIDQISSVNPNYEPMGELIVCTSCGVTIFDTELKEIKVLGIKACPHCNALDPANS